MSDQHGSLPPDEQTQRARWELWAIMIIAVVVIVGSLAWRAIGHHPAKPERAWGSAGPGAENLPAAAAGSPKPAP